MLWDLILFYSSLLASCSATFRGVPLSVLQLNWIAICTSKVWECWGFSLFLDFHCWGFLFCSVCVGRTSHPSLSFFSFFCIFSFSCIFSSINIFFFISDQKNNNNNYTMEELKSYSKTCDQGSFWLVYYYIKRTRLLPFWPHLVHGMQWTVMGHLEVYIPSINILRINYSHFSV